MASLNILFFILFEIFGVQIVNKISTYSGANKILRNKEGVEDFYWGNF